MKHITMSNALKGIALVFIAFVTLACGGAQTQNQDTISNETSGNVAKDVDVESFEKVMAGKPDVQIVDVRTPEEYADGYIKGATLMNIFDEDFDSKIEELDKTKPVAVYCKSGGRSSKAMQKMVDKGFTEVYNLDGGYTAWFGADKPVEK